MSLADFSENCVKKNTDNQFEEWEKVSIGSLYSFFFSFSLFITDATKMLTFIFFFFFFFFGLI